MGPEFLIEIRYSQLISTFYIIMLYSAGMPILYLLAMLQTIVLYWVDKYLFLRLYRTPPRYGPEMAEVTRRVMTYALFLHFAVAFYMYSNSQIFTYSKSFAWLDDARTQTESIGLGSVLG